MIATPMLLVLLAAPAAQSSLARYREVALMPISGLGSTGEAVQAVERVLTAEVEKLLGPRLFTYNELAGKNRRMKEQLDGCDLGLECFTEIFGAHAWQAFIVGNISGLGDERVINLRLIEPAQGGEVRRASEKASGDERELIVQMRKAAVSLLAPELFVGTLELSATQPGLRIVIDGELVGTTPLPSPRLEVPVGRHAIEASGDGLVPFSSMLDIAYGEVVPLTVLLPENQLFVGGDTPFRARWYTWALAGAGVIGLSLAGYFHYESYDSARTIEDLYRHKALRHDHASLNDDRLSQLKTARAFYGIGGALVGTTGVLLLIDLF